MSKQEEASGPLASTGLDAALYQQRFLPSSPSHEPPESQRILSSESESYSPPSSPLLDTRPLCGSPPSPLPPLELGPFCIPPPAPPYSPQPPQFAPHYYYSPELPQFAPNYCYYSTQPRQPQFVCRSPLYSSQLAPPYTTQPQQLEPYTPNTTTQPLESKRYTPPNFEPPLINVEPFKLISQVGLHCYNLHNGTNLQFLGVQDLRPDGMHANNMIVKVEDPIAKSTCKLDTTIWRYKNWREGVMDLVVDRCFLKKTPPEERCWKRLVVDDFFKGDMPNWMPKDALTSSYEMQYYEMKESEVEENKGWLRLFAQLALLALGLYPDETEPFELGKIVVQTKEDVESKKKLRVKNAIFYISFKCSGGQDYNAIIRRTAGSWPHNLSLEVKCCLM